VIFAKNDYLLYIGRFSSHNFNDKQYKELIDNRVFRPDVKQIRWVNTNIDSNSVSCTMLRFGNKFVSNSCKNVIKYFGKLSLVAQERNMDELHAAGLAECLHQLP